MNEVDAQENWDSHIRSQERRSREPTGEEHVEPVDECQDDECYHCNPGSNWLEEGVVWNVLQRETLDFDCFAEADVDDTTTDPGYESRRAVVSLAHISSSIVWNLVLTWSGSQTTQRR